MIFFLKFDDLMLYLSGSYIYDNIIILPSYEQHVAIISITGIEEGDKFSVRPSCMVPELHIPNDDRCHSNLTNIKSMCLKYTQGVVS